MSDEAWSRKVFMVDRVRRVQLRRQREEYEALLAQGRRAVEQAKLEASQEAERLARRVAELETENAVLRAEQQN